jgi:PAS domain S-box-containing protein
VRPNNSFNAWESPTVDAQRLIHELQAHQVELELENEALRRTLLEMKDPRIQYADLHDLDPVAHFILDASGMITEVSLAGAALLCVRRGLLTSKAFSLFLVPEYRNAFKAFREEILRTGSKQRCEVIIQKKNGALVNALLEGTVREERTGARALRVTVSDITTFKRLENGLCQDEKRYRRFFDHVTEGMFLAELDGRIGKVNPAYAKMLGFHSPEEAISAGTDIATQLCADGTDAARFRRLLKRGGTLRAFESRCLRKDGSDLWVSVNALAVKDRDGRATHFEGTVEDITRHKRAEEALRKSEELFRLTFDQSQIGAVLVGLPSRRFVRANESFCQFIGYSEEELRQFSFADITHPEDLPASRELVQRVVTGEISRAGADKRYIRKDGNIVWGHVSIRLVKSDSGRILSALAMVQDITERKRAEETLRESESRFRQLFENVNDGIMVRDTDTLELLLVNPRLCAMYGYSEEELKSIRVGNHHPKGSEYGHRTIKTYYERAKGGEPQLFEWRVRKKDGTLLWVEINLKIVTLGNRNCTLSVIRDISERKRAESRLRESEERYRTLVESSSDAIVLLDTHRRIASCNGAALRLFGDKELEGKSTRVVHPSAKDFRAYGTTAYSAILKENVYRAELELLHKDGHVFPVETVLSGVRDKEGEIVGYVAIIRDITQRKKAEETLRRSEERFRSVYESSLDGIMLTLPDGTALSANRRACQMLGMTEDEIIQTGRAGIVVGDQRLEAALEERTRTGKFQGELTFRRKDGSHIPVELSVSLFTDTDGTNKTSIIIRDITHRKQAEEQIQASLKEKEVLLKEIHHRVKNNLQIISSLLYLQAGKTKNPGAVRALKDSQNRVRSIALIHESLYQSSNLAGIQIGEYTRGLASNLFESYGRRDRPVRLTVRMGAVRLSINTAIPCGLIINELISNSLKHAFPGGREGEIRIQLARTDAGALVLTVSDDGIGIPEHVDFRSSPSLGLTLVSSLVAQLGGTIELDRRGGTTFTITFNNLD